MTKDQLEIAVRAAANEARQHGASEEQVAELLRQFKRITEEQIQQSELRIVPD
jgi:hypothetical protein